MLGGEPVWAVSLRWEIEIGVEENEGMIHLREFIFTQRTLKLVDFSTCG
jgi:hypothetical protein